MIGIEGALCSSLPKCETGRGTARPELRQPFTVVLLGAAIALQRVNLRVIQLDARHQGLCLPVARSA